MIGFDDALAATLAAIAPLQGTEIAPLKQLTGRVVSRDLVAPADSPTGDVSLKDGYAVKSADVAQAAPDRPVRLRLVGHVAAGGAFAGELGQGTAVRILSGAPLPAGADAILAEEFALCDGERVTALADAGPGRNILRRGSDLAKGERLVRAGTMLRPAQVGLLAAAGLREAPVVRRPRVGLIATGDELVDPTDPEARHEVTGAGLGAGLIYSSNLATMAAWCGHYGLETSAVIVGDDAVALRAALLRAIAGNDAVLTSGGAWTSERDLVAGILEELGGRTLYHRVRLGPGKGVGLGLWQGKPVFLLPGGPASNQMAFLQLALPALHKMMGCPHPGLPTRPARLTADVRGQRDWTEFIEVSFAWDGAELCCEPRAVRGGRSSLRSMAGCEGYIKIPEGTETLAAGARVMAQVLPHVPALHAAPAPDIPDAPHAPA